jgi:hypothetical protein
MNNLETFSLDTTYSFDVLNIWSHACAMRERKVLMLKSGFSIL